LPLAELCTAASAPDPGLGGVRRPLDRFREISGGLPPLAQTEEELRPLDPGLRVLRFPCQDAAQQPGAEPAIRVGVGRADPDQRAPIPYHGIARPLIDRPGEVGGGPLPLAQIEEDTAAPPPHPRPTGGLRQRASELRLRLAPTPSPC